MVTEWIPKRRYVKIQREIIDRIMSESSQELSRFEAAAIAEDAALREQLAAAQERIAALEAVLRELVERSQMTSYLDTGIAIDRRTSYVTCMICAESDMHAADCPVSRAKALLNP